MIVDDLPDRLLRDLHLAPVVPEWEIDARTLAGASEELRPSERMVLICLSRGLGMKETGVVLGVSPETVKSELRTARHRLRAKTSAHAACEALRRGLIG